MWPSLGLYGYMFNRLTLFGLSVLSGSMETKSNVSVGRLGWASHILGKKQGIESQSRDWLECHVCNMDSNIVLPN